ncbi:MAG: hypothetical protein J1F64_10200, partial [Oscillospiraceae bacterium]|nr:hypothetical protein [Oscillospiraceae bacterium]
FRNAFMSFASVFTSSGCLVILGICALFIINTNSVIDSIKARCEIQLFIETEASDERVAAVGKEILSIANVASAEFFSKSDMLDFAMNDMFKGREYELSDFENDNPFSDSYKISLKDISKSEETIRELEKIRNTDHILNNQEIINNILWVSSVVKKTGIIVIVLLFILSVVIISNTVRLTVFNRSREINIMKYIGASDDFIKSPFIIEGAVLGLISAVLAFSTVAGIYTEFYKFFQSSGFGTDAIVAWGGMAPFAAAAFLAAGLFIGISGTAFSVKKYLRV